MGILPVLPVVLLAEDNLPPVPDWTEVVEVPLNGWEDELATGDGRIVVFTDGGCEHTQFDCRVRKAGYGGFWGPWLP